MSTKLIIAMHHNPVFGACSTEELDALAKEGEVLQFAAGDTIVEVGEPATFNVLLSGAIRVFHSVEDRQVTVKHLQPPVTFGEMNILANIDFAQGVQALSKVELIRLPAASLHRLLERPEAARRLLEDVSRRFWVAERNQLNLVVDAAGRLAGLLIAYAEILGESVEDGVRLGLPLTHDTLANALGVVPKSVSRALSQWKKDGLVSRSKGSWVLHDIDALGAIAGPMRDHLNYKYERGTRAARGE